MAERGTRHRWEDWVWDETVFEGAAAYYRQGRHPYAPALGDALATHLHLDGRGCLLDVGCGPGTIALLFAHLFESVVGLDPDPGMLAEARRAAADERVTNAGWVEMRAEDLPGSLGTFQVISFAQSFHWMDRPRVASAVREMIDANGAVIQVDLWHTDPPNQVAPRGPYPPIPERAIDELRRRWLGPDRRAGQGFRNTSPDAEDAVFQAAGSRPRRSWSSPTTGSLRARSSTWWPGCSPPHQPHRTSSVIVWTISYGTFVASCSMCLPKVASAWRSRTTDFAFGGRADSRRTHRVPAGARERRWR
jgi:SAM-dependent methyltransferase